MAESGGCSVCGRRDPELPPVCGPCRWLMALRLRELAELAAELASLGFVVRDDRQKWIREERKDDDGQVVEVVVVTTNFPADPVAYWLTPGPIAGASRAPRVAGSRERGVPARFDLLAPAYRTTVGVPGRRDGTHDPDRDQVGTVSVAAVLDSWCRDWIEAAWCPGEHLPLPTIGDLAGWLAVRLEVACDHHPAIGDFAEELRQVHLALRSANGLTEPRPELCDGVPCRRPECDQKALHRVPGSPWVECGSCGLLYTEDEYQEWVRLVASSVRKKGAAA